MVLLVIQRIHPPRGLALLVRCSMDQSPRLQHKQETQLSGDQAAVPVLAPPVDDQGQLHPQPSEHPGRCPLQRSTDSLRVGLLSGVILSTASPSKPPGESVCTSRECAPSSVQVPVPQSQGSGPQCPNSGLEQVGLNLSLPSSSTHSRVPAKASRTRWPRHFCGTRLTSHSLVVRAPCKRLPARSPPSGTPVCLRHFTHCT